MIAIITRSVESGFGSYEEEFSTHEVGSFQEAIAVCEKCGSAGGLIPTPGVNFLEVDEDSMSATFEILNRLRYVGDRFYLNVTK